MEAEGAGLGEESGVTAAGGRRKNAEALVFPDLGRRRERIRTQTCLFAVACFLKVGSRWMPASSAAFFFFFWLRFTYLGERAGVGAEGERQNPNTP